MIVNGFEYLDKIVQMPFALPALTNEEKKKLFEGYLNPQVSTEDDETAEEKETAHLEPNTVQLFPLQEEEPKELGQLYQVTRFT